MHDETQQAQAYLDELRRLDQDHRMAPLRTLAREFEPTLTRLPNLRRELDRLMEPGEGIDYTALAARVEPALDQATHLLLELDLLPEPVRRAAEIENFVHALAATITPRTTAALTEKFRQLCGEVKATLAQAVEAERRALGEAEAKRQAQERAKRIAADIHSAGFQDNGDGTLTDLSTGLTWKRCAEGQKWEGNTCVGVPMAMTWDQAMSNEKQKKWPPFAGKSDWRVPSIDELMIFDDSPGNSSRDCVKAFFRGSSVFTTYLWSSSPHLTDKSRAWHMQVGGRAMNARRNSDYVRNYVLLVSG